MGQEYKMTEEQRNEVLKYISPIPFAQGLPIYNVLNNLEPITKKIDLEKVNKK